MNDFKPIPQSEMDVMKAREDAATKGPWDEYDLPFSASSGGADFCQGCYCIEWENEEADRRFIAHARHDQTYLREGYQALLAEYEKQRECLREAKVQHRICRVDCVGLGDECDCGASEYNARIDAVLGREGHGVR